MNKFKRCFIVSTMIASFIGISTSFAYSPTQNIKAIVNGANVTIDGQSIYGNNLIYNGEVYIPGSKIAEYLGKEYKWDKSKAAASIKNKATTVTSFEKPAPIGKTETVNVPDSALKSYRAEMTVKEIIRGDDAFSIIRDANAYLPQPSAKEEYILVKVNLKLLDVKYDKALYVSGSSFFTVYSGTTYPYFMNYTTAPSPALEGYLYKGDSIEGWVAYRITKGDKKPRLNYGHDMYGNGGAWFKLY